MELKRVAILLLLVLISAWPVSGKVIYVDDDATGANDGTSWENAYKYLQDALADANSAEKPLEIRVAKGVYKPDQGANQTPGDRKATFQIIDGVVIKGGYAGFGEPYPDARDIRTHETILSGDLAGNDVDVNDPRKLLGEASRAENSYHVVTINRIVTMATIDGLRITAGNANGSDLCADFDPDGLGGGIHNASCSVTVVKCTLSRNSAKCGAGGVYNHGSRATFHFCTFSENSTTFYGGGMYNRTSSIKMVDCNFHNNSAGQDGGGMSNIWYTSVELVNCLFTGNSAENGGGIDNLGSTITLANCVLSQNTAGKCGGGMYNFGDDSSATLSSCTFAGNSAEKGSAIACSHLEFYRTQLVHCILWDGGYEIWNEDGSKVEISFSNVQGGDGAVYDPCESTLWKQGNIDADPCFADPGYWDPNGTPDDPNDDFWLDGDYHLKSQAGRWDPGSQSWVKDDVSSPCIDAGDLMCPIGLEPFPNGGRINMGAYGGTAEASKSYFGEPVCEIIVAGDINGDCKVDLADFAIMTMHWLEDNSF